MKYYFLIKSWDKSNNSVNKVSAELADAVSLIERMYCRYFNDVKGFWTENEMHHEHELGGTIETIFSVDLPDDSMLAETGIHRVLQKSPYDKKGRRYTNYVYVFVSSEDTVNSFELEKTDTDTVQYRGGITLRIPTVKMKHVSSGISMSCYDESKALNLLKMAVMSSKVKYEVIRSYIISDSYSGVLDIRTGVQIKEVQRVIDGELDLIYSSVSDEKITEDGE